MNYDQFKTFYKKHRDGPIKLYYDQFPEGNKSTIRSYKYRAERDPNCRDETVATKKKQKKKRSSQPHSKKEKTPKGRGPRPLPRFSDLNDTELSRHRVRQVLLDATDNRIILDAAKTLMSHQEKTGELNLIKQEKESENISQFLSRPINELAQLASGKYLPTEPSPSLEKEESF